MLNYHLGIVLHILVCTMAGTREDGSSVNIMVGKREEKEGREREEAAEEGESN